MQCSNLCKWAEVDSGGDGGASAACGWPSPGCCGASPCACKGVQYFSMKALVMGGRMTLLGVTDTP